MKKTLLTTGILAMALTGGAYAQTLKVGVATAQTGALAHYDGPVVEGLQMGVDEINAAGGIGGTLKIELVEKDVRSDAAQTAIATQELVDAGVKVLILPCDADPSLAAISIVGSAQVPAISTCASSPTLPMIGGDYMFANFPGDNVQATVSAQWAYDQGMTTAYIVYSPDTQYTSMPLYFADVMETLGGEVVGRDTYTLGQQDFSAIATRIANMDPQPDVVMTSAYEPDFPSFIKALRAAGVTSQVIGSDGIDSPTTFAIGPAADRLVFTTAGHPTENSPMAEFNAKYKETYGEESQTVFNAIGYDLAKVIEAASLAAGPDASSDELRDAIANLENVQGATSLITYKGTNGMPVREVTLIGVMDGERQLIGQPSPNPAIIPAPRMQ